MDQIIQNYLNFDGFFKTCLFGYLIYWGGIVCYGLTGYLNVISNSSNESWYFYDMYNYTINNGVFFDNFFNASEIWSPSINSFVKSNYINEPFFEFSKKHSIEKLAIINDVFLKFNISKLNFPNYLVNNIDFYNSYKNSLLDYYTDPNIKINEDERLFFSETFNFYNDLSKYNLIHSLKLYNI